MTSGTEKQIVNAIESAEEIRDPLIAETLGQKPRLLIEDCNPDRTVAAAGGLYDRGVPVRLAFDQIQRGTVAQVMTPDALVLMAHAVCRPYVLKARPDGTVTEVNARLPRSFAVMYLDWRGEWRLAPLNGIASAPLLQDDVMLGADLAEFLLQRRDARRQPCRAGQMFCLKCRKPQEPAGRMADFAASSATSGAPVRCQCRCGRDFIFRGSARFAAATGPPPRHSLTLHPALADVWTKMPASNAPGQAGLVAWGVGRIGRSHPLWSGLCPRQVDVECARDLGQSSGRHSPIHQTIAGGAYADEDRTGRTINAALLTSPQQFGWYPGQSPSLRPHALGDNSRWGWRYPLYVVHRLALTEE